ncbi:MAG: hypothetical protein VXW08_06960, partial [Candidatus Thermoplasmatota archaeon]|nr:hypothetical protein [Candidatus Thermoplasmatota archaeon]
PGLSQEKPGCPENVLLEVLLEIGVVLLDKNGVVGFLRCLSLTRKSRQSRQDHANGMFQLGTL